MSWRKLPVSLTELSIDTTLRCGQSFRWKRSEDDANHLHYRTILPSPQEQKGKRKRGIPFTPKPEDGSAMTELDSAHDDEMIAYIRHYLNLSTNLEALYDQWSLADPNFRKKAPKFTGVRILRQDAWEALVGFICSSNNNISRICQMMDKLCAHYGPLIGYVDSQPFYDMPPPTALTGSKVESHLRELGFGYRAKYLHQTAVMITQESDNWLENLRNPENPVFGRAASNAGEMKPSGRAGYRAAHEALLSLQGVGPKVADCVCLMGLGWGEAVPVDTHVWQIAQRDYKFGKGKNQSLTKQTYDAVGDHFRKLWGKEAGWAHSVLFTADLRAFSERLTAKVELKDNTTELNGSAAQASTPLKVKVEVAPALPDKSVPNGEQPLVKAEETVSVRATEMNKGDIIPKLKQEVAEEVMQGSALETADEGRRRSKRQKRAL